MRLTQNLIKMITVDLEQDQKNWLKKIIIKIITIQPREDGLKNKEEKVDLNKKKIIILNMKIIKSRLINMRILNKYDNTYEKKEQIKDDITYENKEQNKDEAYLYR